MRILVSNDDGIHAEGLKALRTIAAALSDDVWVCAPEEEQSGKGRALTLSDPLRVRRLEDRVFAVNGTPTDCVMLACQEILPALPDLVLGIGPQRLAALAAKAMAPKKPPVVSVDHIHMVRVSVREHAATLREQLLRLRTASFRTLCADCQSTLEIVARFLALLEMYREGLVAFEQLQALGELTVRWTGADDAGELEIDEYAGAPAESGGQAPAGVATERVDG